MAHRVSHIGHKIEPDRTADRNIESDTRRILFVSRIILQSLPCGCTHIKHAGQYNGKPRFSLCARSGLADHRNKKVSALTCKILRDPNCDIDYFE